MDMTEIASRVTIYLRETFLFDDNAVVIDPAESLVDSGIIDSAAVLSLILYLEDEFEITVEDDEILPENIDSVDCIATFVKAKLVAADSSEASAS